MNMMVEKEAKGRVRDPVQRNKYGRKIMAEYELANFAALALAATNQERAF